MQVCHLSDLYPFPLHVLYIIFKKKNETIFKKSLKNCFPQPSLQLTLAEAIHFPQSEETLREESKVMVLPVIADGTRVENYRTVLSMQRQVFLNSFFDI
jgi:hypothetical protein